MYSGYRRIFWGILLLLIQIEIGPIPILQIFAGYLLIASGISCMKRVAVTRNLIRAFRVANIMLIGSLLDFMLRFLESNTGFFVPRPYMALLSGVMMTFLIRGLELLLFYDILSTSSKILRFNNDFSLADDTDKRLRMFLVAQTILSITTLLLFLLPYLSLFLFPNFFFPIFGFIIVIFISWIVMKIWLASVFARLKRRYGQPDSTFTRKTDEYQVELSINE